MNTNISLNQLDRYLEKQDIASDFLLVGDDFGQIIYISDCILKKYFGDGRHYIDTFYYPDLKKDSSLLQSALQSLQLFTEKKAIIIKMLGDSITKDILELIKNKKDNTLLILQGENLRKSSKTYKALESITKLCLIKCYKLDANATAVFINSFLQKNDVRYKKELPSIIAHFLPNNILLIKNELEKVFQYLDGDELTIEIIEKVISGIRDFSYINLCKAIIFKDKKKILEQIRRMNNEEIGHISIIRILQSYFAKVLYIKREEKLKMCSVHDVINSLKPPVFFKEKSALLDICNKTNYYETVNLMYELMKLEIDYKTVNANSNNLFSLFSLCTVNKDVLPRLLL